MDYRIFPPEELIEDGFVTLPISKSIVNRALTLDLLAGHGADAAAPSPDGGTGDEAFDITLMRSAVSALATAAGEEVEINLGESGTALRFLTAAVASRPGCRAVLTGEPGLMRRPIGELVEALRRCGADITYLGDEGHAPLRVTGLPLSGGEIEVDATISSQFVSALLMAAPFMTLGLKLKLLGEPASLPYIKMTIEMMRRRGVEVEILCVSPLAVEVKPAVYAHVETDAEADWSAAAFWYEVVALTAGWITLDGHDGVRLPLPDDSIQGDAAAAGFFQALGVDTDASEETPGAVALTPSPEVFGRLDLDLTDHPDLAPPLTVTCCMLGVPFKFVGLRSLSIKECDRLSALAEEMDKVGCDVVKIRDYGLEWEGKRHPIISLPEFDSRGDHRLAMAFAPVAAYIPGIVVKDAGCVAKSYPGYWDALRAIGFKTVDPSLPLPEPQD